MRTGERLRGALPLLAVLGVVAVGLLAVELHYWRKGTELVGLAVLFAAALRLTLPERRAGLLAVRSRAYDVAVLVVVGGGVVVLGALVPYVEPLPPPGG